MKFFATVIFFALLFACVPALAGWLWDGVPVCMESGEQSYIDIASDGAGGAFITWVDRRGYPDIHAQRLDGMGRIHWTLNGML